MSPSYHHAYITGNLIAAFHKLAKYSVFSELTIQIQGKDYIPDICLYSKREIDFTAGDIIRMTEMPLLATEVVSPTQCSQDAVDKFKIYIEAGIKSCWLVVPISRAVIVYSEIGNAQIFHTGDISDSVLGISFPVDEIFV